MRTPVSFLILCLLWHLAEGQSEHKPLKITSLEQYPLNKRLYHYQPARETISIFDAITLRENGFFKLINSPTSRQEFGYNKAIHWLYFEIESNATPPDLILEIEYANINNLELFEVVNGRVKSLGLTGDTFKFDQRPISNNNYVFPIQPKPSTKTGYYLLINHKNAILSFYAHLTQATYFKKIDRWEYGLWGIFTGIIFFILIVNSFFWYDTRDWIYFWYNVYITFVTLHLYSDAGLGFQFLWPELPAINDYNPVYLTIWVALAAQLTFMQHFIHQTRERKAFKWVMLYKYIVIVALVAVISIQFFGLEGQSKFLYQTLVSLTSYFVVGMIILATWSLVEAHRESEQLVKYYSYALGVQFVAYASSVIINIVQDQGGTMPFEIETYIILAFSALVDISFFSYGLGYRYNFIRAKNQDLALEIFKVQQELSSKVIETLEEERRRIAQDLHDDVGATLATAKGYLSTLTKKAGANATNRNLLESQELIDKASEDLRAISHNLMPKSFSKWGISLALEETVRKIAIRNELDVKYVCIGKEVRMVPKIEMQIFRIATELLSNTLKHAQATEATLQLSYHHDCLNVIVEDNGKGFDETIKKGTGLRNLQSRADLINAEMTIDSSIHGTTVVIEMPYQEYIL